MLIGQLARQAGCEVETIRYYEHEGLLSAPERTAAGYRSYRSEHLGELNFILHCRSLDMSLAEVRILAGFRSDPQQDCAGINDLIDRHLETVHQQVESLQLLEQQLLALRERCPASRDAAHCGILRTLVDAAQGEACACHTPFGDGTRHGHTEST
ncbi:Cd(II)/Pb(II)-responsive transcriptional regulator [Paludibacterium yongneupense]|uniref:Cd(II)/Pb(II)-responsive transcriptional regulator n=1 Tax=Paludibacterium yongneupense TaxID=400061 RepID=UPI0004035E5D|nr:Cd(II)/Pb(II)-responsive transcriptional regulator [Paludibacterium yongneupense]